MLLVSNNLDKKYEVLYQIFVANVAITMYELLTKYLLAWVEYMNAMWLHLTSFFFGCDGKNLQEMAEDSVAIEVSTIQKFVKTVKSLQSDMAELKSV